MNEAVNLKEKFKLFSDLWSPKRIGKLNGQQILLAKIKGEFVFHKHDDEDELFLVMKGQLELVLEDRTVVLNKGEFKVTFNKDFKAVITNCQSVKRVGQNGTWITDDMINAYCKLHELGFAKSVEVWKDNELVGGLYGIDLGDVFCGESMFSTVSNASKVAFITLAQKLEKSNYKLIDCQVHNSHLESLGCIEIDRDEFMAILNF